MPYSLLCSTGLLTTPVTGLGFGAEESPGVEGRIAEELVHGSVILDAALLDAVVLNSLAFIDGGVSAGLHLELVDRIDRDGGPDVARVAIASGAHERNAVDIHRRDGAAAARSIDDSGVGGGVAGGVVALHARHQEREVGGAALVGLP